MNNEVKQILEAVQRGEMNVDDALLRIKTEPFEDIGYAKVDLHRKVRQGAAEVIYGAGKTPEQIIGIAETMKRGGQNTILITRLSAEAAEIVQKAHDLHYHASARVGIIGWALWAKRPRPPARGSSPWPPAAPATCRWRRKPR